MATLTDANSVDLKLKTQKSANKLSNVTTSGGGDLQANLPIDDFNFNKSQDKPPQHGIGNEDPVGLTTGNAEYTASLTLLGDDKNLFSEVWEDAPNPIVELHVTLDETKMIVKGLDETDVELSASDGSDPIELSIDFNATNITREDVNKGST